MTSVGALLIAGVIYWAICTLAFLAAVLLLDRNVVVDAPWILPIQRELYLNGGWQVWQARPDCVEFDPTLIYKPKRGACRFANPEFDTVLNFTDTGRDTGDVESGGKAIAVLGDSFAMGWGVGDAETFSAELQRRTGRRVFNLAVSSYGTVRELMRLEAFALLDSVDTVVIQYCDNDLDENVKFEVPPTLADAERRFATVTAPRRSDRWSFLKYLYRGYRLAFWYPISASLGMVLGETGVEDFGPHRDVLAALLRKTAALQGKRIVVFYTRGYGMKFKNFPVGPDTGLENLTFVDVALGPEDFYVLDPHLNKAGHQATARKLAEVLSRP